SAQAFSSIDLGLESRSPKRRNRRLFGPLQQRNEESDDGRAGPSADGFRGPEQLRPQARPARHRGVVAQGVEQGILRHAVVDTVSDPEGFYERWLGFIELTGEQRSEA